MPSDVTATSSTPYGSPLTFRTEVRSYLYLASIGLLVLGGIFVAFSLWEPPGLGPIGIIISAAGVFMLYAAWVNFWTTRAGYPHLILRGHQLSVRSSDAFRTDLDLTTLGDSKVVVIAGGKGSQNVYLGFLPAPGATLKPRPFVAPKLQQFAETILLNGYVGENLRSAADIERVIDARRAEPRQEIAPLADDAASRRSARLRLIATAAVFAALWVTIVWRVLLP